MTREHVLGDPAELAALYLAGALAEADRAGFEAHLAVGCPLCSRECASLDAAVVQLAGGLPASSPPAEVLAPPSWNEFHRPGGHRRPHAPREGISSRGA